MFNTKQIKQNMWVSSYHKEREL